MDNKTKPKVAIILPTLNVWPHIKAMIEALYGSTNFPFKLIVVDGFSTDGTFEYLCSLMKEKNNIKIYQIPRKGLVNAVNYGIKQAKELDVYLTQADVIHFRLYGRDWLMEMHYQAQREEIGLVMGLGGGGISGDDYIKGLHWAGTWNTYIPRKTIKKIGLFDEQFLGGDDIDYSYRVGLAKMKGIICNFWVQHHQLTDHDEFHNPDHWKKMGELFRKKWNINQ